jgi:hypothetical protein
MSLTKKSFYAFEYAEEHTLEERFVRFVARAGKVGFVFRGIIYFVVGVSVPLIFKHFSPDQLLINFSTFQS